MAQSSHSSARLSGRLTFGPTFLAAVFVAAMSFFVLIFVDDADMDTDQPKSSAAATDDGITASMSSASSEGTSERLRGMPVFWALILGLLACSLGHACLNSDIATQLGFKIAARTGTTLALIVIVVRLPDYPLTDPFLQDWLGTQLLLLAPLFFLALICKVSLRRPWLALAITVVSYALQKWTADVGIQAPLLHCEGQPCTVLVTGANSGIGLALSKELAIQGHSVVMGCRSASRCAAACEAVKRASGGEGLVYCQGGLDLSSLKAVHHYVAALKAVKPKLHLDILFNNAGFLPVGNTTTEDGFEAGFGSMHLGPYALMRWMLQQGILQRNATVVMVSSEAMRFGSMHSSLLDNPDGEGDLRGEVTVGCAGRSAICPPRNEEQMLGEGLYPWQAAITEGRNWGSYARAKLLNVYFAQEVKSMGDDLYATSVHPGMVHTPILGHGEGIRGFLQELVMAATLRPPQAAARVVMSGAAVRGSAPSGSYLNGMGKPVQVTESGRTLLSRAKVRKVCEELLKHWELHGLR